MDNHRLEKCKLLLFLPILQRHYLAYASLFLIANEIRHIRMMDEETKNLNLMNKHCCFKFQKLYHLQGKYLQIKQRNSIDDHKNQIDSIYSHIDIGI